MSPSDSAPRAPLAVDDDAALLSALSDRDLFIDVLAHAFGVSREEARDATGRLFYHYMDPWGRLLDRVVDEGDPKVFSREDRRDLVQLAKLGVVAVRSTEVTKADSRGRGKTFTQYHYVLHLDAIRQRLVAAMGENLRGALRPAGLDTGEDDGEAGGSDVYADPSLWSRRKA